MSHSYIGAGIALALGLVVAACGGSGFTPIAGPGDAGDDGAATPDATTGSGSDAGAADAAADVVADAPDGADAGDAAADGSLDGPAGSDAQADAGCTSQSCPGGQICVSGACQCPIYQSFCNGMCIPTSNDPQNCGGCGVVCPAGQACSAGQCSTSCLPPLVQCGQSCVDPQNDNQNCGGCNMPCPSGQGCSRGQCVPVVAVGGSGPNGCVGGGPPVVLGGSTGTCSGNTAQTTFTWALCSCGDVSMHGSMYTDAYDSSQGPYKPGGLGGGVGLDGAFSATSHDDIGGTLWSSADGGLATGSNTNVAQELHVGGPTSTTASIKVGLDGFFGGNVDGTAGSIAISGTMYLDTGKAYSGSVTYGAFVQQPLTVPPPCACDPQQLLPVASWVAAVRPPNDDDAVIGLDPNALAAPLGYPVRLDLPCGMYYLTSIDNGSDPVTIVAHGHTGLFIDGNVSAATIDFTLDPSATFDIAVAGVVMPRSGSDLDLGSPNYPALCRLYEGGTSATTFSGGSLAGDLYCATSPLQVSSTLTAYGSLFVGSFSNSSETYIHYDRANLQASAPCPPPGGSPGADAGVDGGPSCGSCKDCGNQACINGSCGKCTSSSQCCPPLVCLPSGACALP